LETIDPAEALEHDAHGADPFKSRAAMLVSVLAMILALASLGGSNAAKDATQHNILAANAYAFFQAKNIRQTAYKLAADDIELQLLRDTKLPEATRAQLQKKLEDYKKTVARYESEPENREGKRELIAQAKEHEHHRDVALRKDPWFDYAEAALQIGIVLASVAIIMSTPALLYAAAFLGLLGALSTLNGYFLFY
jgi:hypothetical protein